MIPGIRYPLNIKKGIAKYCSDCLKITLIWNLNRLYLLTSWLVSQQQTGILKVNKNIECILGKILPTELYLIIPSRIESKTEPFKSTKWSKAHFQKLMYGNFRRWEQYIYYRPQVMNHWKLFSHIFHSMSVMDHESWFHGHSFNILRFEVFEIF